METVSLYHIAKDYADEIMREHAPVTVEEINFLADVTADGSEWVIYYGKSWQLVASLDGGQLGEAQDRVLDCWGGEYMDINTHMGALAYFALGDAIAERLYATLEGVAA